MQMGQKIIQMKCGIAKLLEAGIWKKENINCY